MLGPYAIKLPTALIIGKRTQSSAACPELVRAGNGCRMAVLQEPDQKDVINIGILKELSGNDTFFARGLFKEGSEITPLFKLVLICNELPNLHNSDRATWNRIRVIPFEATFSDEAPATLEEQLRDKIFPKDAQFKDKIPGMTEALAWYLLERLKTKPKQLAEPHKVTKATEHYRRKNDVYRLFSEEFVETVADKSVQLIELYSTFKDWFRESFPNCPLPSKIELKEYFSKKWGEPVGIHQVWKGYCIRSNFEI
jgi:phage/plasmid-associated DNA primase